MAPYNYDDREVTYEIVEEIGVLAEQSTGWRKELNVVSWNGGQAKYDIRDWSPDHRSMGKGLTLNEREMRTIIELLKRRARTSRYYTAQGERDDFGSSGGGAQERGDRYQQAQEKGSRDGETMGADTDYRGSLQPPAPQTHAQPGAEDDVQPGAEECYDDFDDEAGEEENIA